MEELLNSGNHSDLVITCPYNVTDGSACWKEFNVHKCILTAKSSVFDAMFNHDMTEHRDKVIKITDISARIMKLMLRFVYSQDTSILQNLSYNDVLYLLEAANKYNIVPLTLACQKRMGSLLNIENVMDTLDVAEKYDAQLLENSCINFIVMNCANLRKREDFTRIKHKPEVHLKLTDAVMLEKEELQAEISRNSRGMAVPPTSTIYQHAHPIIPHHHHLAPDGMLVQYPLVHHAIHQQAVPIQRHPAPVAMQANVRAPAPRFPPAGQNNGNNNNNNHRLVAPNGQHIRVPLHNHAAHQNMVNALRMQLQHLDIAPNAELNANAGGQHNIQMHHHHNAMPNAVHHN